MGSGMIVHLYKHHHTMYRMQHITLMNLDVLQFISQSHVFYAGVV